MDPKICLPSLIFFLLAVSKVSRAQTPTSSQHGSGHTSTMSSLSTDPRVSGTDSSRLTPPAAAATTLASSTRVNTSTAKNTTVVPSQKTPKPVSTPAGRSPHVPAKGTPFAAVAWDPKWDQDFNYDYKSLRQAGLSIAAVLFVMGIMVLGCEKACRGLQCRKKASKSYQVAQV